MVRGLAPSLVARDIENYQPCLGALVPERVWFFARSKQVNDPA